jgi:hypothetical protein
MCMSAAQLSLYLLLVYIDDAARERIVPSGA